MTRDATIPRGHVRLAARLLTPAGQGPFPCVLFVHGLGSDKDSPRNVVVAELLVDAGIGALLFDLSGHGESTFDPRGAEAMPADLAAAWAWTLAQPEVEPRRAGISGSSLGGVVALEAMAAGDVAPAALVLRAPPVSASQLRRLNVPTLVVIGSLDPLLPGLRGVENGGGAVHFEVVPGASHLFDEPGTLECAAGLTVAWFVRHLLAGAARVAN